MRSYVSVLSLLCAVLFLSGCGHTLFDPQPMGRGYSSYKEAYKSTKGYPANDVGYDFSVANNDAVIEDMRFAAQDLVAKLDSDISFSIDRIYLDVPQNGVFYASFDYLLRDELTKHGYALDVTPKDALSVTLVARNVEGEAPVDDKMAYRKIYLGLALDVVKNTAGTILGDVYEVPAHDFRPTKPLKLAVVKDKVCAKTAGKACCEKTPDGAKCDKCSPCNDCSKCEKCSKGEKCEKCQKSDAQQVCSKSKDDAGAKADIEAQKLIADDVSGAPLELKGGKSE